MHTAASPAVRRDDLSVPIMPGEPEAASSTTGQTIGRYRVLRPLGAGGMGEVFLAEDPQLSRRVALKVLPAAFAADRHRLQRFFHEARAAAALSHPNVAHIYELGEGEGAPFIAMEYVEGETLADRIARKPVDLALANSVALQVAAVLAAAHRAGVIHRDIKPANVMLDKQEQVKVLDFGLARAIDPSSSLAPVDAATVTFTRAGTILGTPPYMSPEQLLGRTVDSRTDIFSFGVLLYELLAGRRPFEGQTATELADNILHQDAEAVSLHNDAVGPELERIVHRCLEKSADLRYQTADDLLADLKGAQRVDTSAVTAQRVAQSRLQRPRARRPWIVASVALLLVAGLLIAGAAVVWRRQTVTVAQPAAAHRISSLAVLPFINNDDAGAQYLADGITQSLIDDLSRLPGIKVMARNSVMAFRGKNQNARAAAQKLGVGTVMTGTVRQTGSRVDISVEWIDAADGSLILSRTYSATPTDVAALQSTVAYDVASKLRLKLTDRERHFLDRETTDSEAYRLRLKGLFYANRFDPQSLHTAIDYDKQAVERDPDYAVAYSDMARAYFRLGMYFEPPKEMMPQAKAMAYKASQLDPSLADPHMTLGIVDLLYDWNRRDAEKEMVSTSGIAPAAIEAFTCTAHLLQSTGRADDGEKAIRRALLTDPMSPAVNTELACNSYYQHHFDVAVREYREALELDPRNVVGHWGLGRALELQNQYDAAVAELRKVKALNGFEPPMVSAEIGYSLARAGRSGEAREVLRDLRARTQKTYVDPFFLAIVELGLDEREQTFGWLSKAVEARSPRIPSLYADPKFEELRHDSRFAALRRQIGI